MRGCYGFAFIYILEIAKQAKLGLQMDTELGSINIGGPHKASPSEEPDLLGGPPLLMDFGRWLLLTAPSIHFKRRAFATVSVNKRTAFENPMCFKRQLNL